MSFVLPKFFSTGQPGLLKYSYPHRPSSMGIGVVFNPTACFPGPFAERLSLCSRFAVEIFFPPGWILNYFFPPKKTSREEASTKVRRARHFRQRNFTTRDWLPVSKSGEATSLHVKGLGQPQIARGGRGPDSVGTRRDLPAVRGGIPIRQSAGIQCQSNVR